MKKYNHLMVFVLIMIPIIGILGTSIYSYYNGVIWQEPLLMILGWWFSGMGITFGYHRLFAHKSFKAHPVIQFIAMICGSAALQNNVIKWCSDHRLHHRKLDTQDDPYSITQGFFHAHIGWIMEDKPENIEGVDDLQNNPILKFQYKYYWLIAISISFLLPFIIGLYYGRPFGFLLWGGFLRLTLVHHSTFFINSLCHYAGNRPFEFNSSARDSWWVAYLTFGEGFHNFHHKFQWDYRNGIRWYDFDPGKWIIKLLSFFKITYSLKKVSKQNILKARINTLNRKIKEVNFNNIYSEKIQIITEDAMKNLELWKNLELKYKSFKKIKVNKDKKQFYKEKVKLYNLKIQQSLSALMIIFANLKNLN